MNPRRFSVYRDPISRSGRLVPHGDTYRKNDWRCSDTGLVAKGEESERLLKVLVAKAQDSIEASRSLISKIDAILRRR
jgi:hypothetical protein